MDKNGWPIKKKKKGEREYVDTHLTPYERLCAKLKDPLTLKEVADGKRLGFYEIKDKLGDGAFAKVVSATHGLVKTKVAIKMVARSGLDARISELLEHEISCMEKLSHPHIIRLYEIIETAEHICMVQEMAIAGDLATKVIMMGTLSEESSRRYFGQILSAIHYMHENNIIHRDIKPQNVLINAGDVCKIADLGFARTVTSHDSFIQTFCGTPNFAAPELFKDELYLGPFVDIWALGVTLFFMVHGLLPFRSDTFGTMRQDIMSVTYNMPERFSPALKKLISQIFQLVPSHRLTMPEIMRSEWMEGAVYTGPLRSYRMRAPLEDETKDNVEKQVVENLNTLGITNEVIAQSPVDTIRDRINGSYRLAYFTQERKIFREQQIIDERKEENRIKREKLRNEKKSAVCSVV